MVAFKAAAPDISITKTHTGNFTQGQTGATYTITVTNNGPGSTSGTIDRDRYSSGVVDSDGS